MTVQVITPSVHPAVAHPVVGQGAAPGSSAPVHHLRERVLATSRVLLAEGGLAALSMREVARRAGVTHQAPYHHFPDKESILAELVTEGFEELARRMARANDAAPLQGKREVLRLAAEAYLGFALEQPAVFRVMFRPELCDPARFPRAQAAAERARAECERLVRLVHDGRFSQALASMHWAHVHGLACLVLDGPLGAHLPTAKARQDHLEEASAHFVHMVAGGPPPPLGSAEPWMSPVPPARS